MKNNLIAFAGFLFFSSIIYGQQSRYVKPKIYAVIVGISNYKDKSIPNLKFPEKDAQAFHTFLLSPNAGSVPEENMALLTGIAATRSNILKELFDKFSRAGKEDMIIFYFSGHAKVGFTGTGLFLTYDTDWENDVGTAVSMKEIIEDLDNFQAKMKISYVDACHAGLFTSNGKGIMQEDNKIIAKTFLESLSKSQKGSVRFLSSSAEQQSGEDEKLGHGIFTYYLLKGLKGEADFSQPGTNTYNDGIVNMSELDTYLTDSISEHTKFRQRPSIEGKYNDLFPVSILKTNTSLIAEITKTQNDQESKPALQNTPTVVPARLNNAVRDIPDNNRGSEKQPGSNNADASALKIANTINGNWSGSAYQGKKSFSIVLSCDFGRKEFRISYPSQGCSGSWTIETMSDKSIDFREHISAGKLLCVDGGLVRVSIINSTVIECDYFKPSSDKVMSKGTLMKQ